MDRDYKVINKTKNKCKDKPIRYSKPRWKILSCYFLVFNITAIGRIVMVVLPSVPLFLRSDGKNVADAAYRTLNETPV